MKKNHLNKFRIILILLVFITAGISGCDRWDRRDDTTDSQTETATDIQTEDATDSQTEDQTPGCPQAFLSIAESFKWPAGGHELILRAEDNSGSPWEGPLNCLSITADEPDAPLASEITPHTPGPGITLIAVQPGPSDDPAAYQEAIRSFIDTRPSSERIAVYGWGNELIQITDFTLRRQRLLAQLNRIDRVSADENPLDAQAAFDQALEIVTRVENPNMKGLRSVVFISGNAVNGTVPRTRQGIAAQWVLPANEVNIPARGNVMTFGNSSGLKSALNQVSEQLDRNAAEAYYKIAVCSNPSEKTPAHVSPGTGKPIAVELKKSIKGERNGTCEVTRITAGDRNGVDTVQLFLTDEQLVVYQERLDAITALRARFANLPDAMRRAMILSYTTRNGWGETKEDFDLSVSLDPSLEPVEATAHFRGQNALFCDRKSYTVNLSGKDARFFGEESGSDEFYLIAMCQDPYLFHAYLADTLYSEYDLFPLRFRYVELLLNNETQGIYLMMEKRKEELQRDNARLRGILRRKYEGLAQAEVNYTINDEATMLAAYRETLAGNVSDDQLPEYLRERMDLDQYLHWMGVNSIIENADTLDECLFISTESIDAAGLATDYFRLMAWDPEDMQGVCPAGDLFENDYNLTFCQESAIERRIINHPVIFGEYVDILKALLADVGPEKFQVLLDRVKTDLFPLLERDGVVQAMQRPDWIDAETAQSLILEGMDEAKQRFEARYNALETGVQNYEETEQ